MRKTLPRHFSRLTADQRTAGKLAALGNAFDHVGGDLLFELSAGEIIEEEERLRALHEHVVGAHRHEVDTHGTVSVERKGKLELGADAVRAGDKYRLLVFLGDLAKRAEAADAREHLRAHGLPREGLDGLDERVAGVDIDARIAVGESVRHAKILRDATITARHLYGGGAGTR